jgi:hypothetical protein
MGLEELHKNNLCFFDSDYPKMYVISKGKIKFCNIELCSKKNSTDKKKWDQRLNREIKKFGKLIAWLLDTGVAWPEKDSFLQCFENLTKKSCRDLRVIYTHPFLICDKKYAVQILEDAYHALSSKDDDVRDYSNLKTFVQNTNATVIIGRNVRWLPDDQLLNPKFYNTLWYGVVSPNNTIVANPNNTSGASSSTRPNYHNNIGTVNSDTRRPTVLIANPQNSFGNQPAVTNTPKHNYSPSRCKDLIKFLRNVYQHYYTRPDKINIGEVYDEIKKHWPKLIDTIHVASWA